MNMFVPDNSVNEQEEMTSRKVDEPEVEPEEERGYTFASPVNTIEEDDGEDGLFLDDEFDIIEEESADQTINAEGMMDVNSTKDRLQKKAQ